MIVVSGVVLERLPQVGLAEDNCVIEWTCLTFVPGP